MAFNQSNNPSNNKKRNKNPEVIPTRNVFSGIFNHFGSYLLICCHSLVIIEMRLAVTLK